jgi:hypothetical protein
MADVDPLSLFPTTAPSGAPPAASSSSGTAAKDDDPLKLFPTMSPKKQTDTSAAQSGTPSVDEYGRPIAPLAAAPTPPTSLEDLRTQMQQGETNVLNALRPGPDAGWLEQAGRTGAAVGVHALGTLAQFPVNALIGLGQGPSGAVTIDPATNTLGLTPEASAAEQLLTGGGPAGRDIRFSGPRPLEFVPPSGTFDQKGPLPPDTAANLLTPEAKAKVAEAPAGPAAPTGVPPPETATPQPAPQPAGAAATPPGMATISPQEEAAYRATAEGKKLLENQRIGEPDATAYVPGVTPNSAELEQTANAARELKSMGITSADATDQMKVAAQANNDARTQYWQDTARSPHDIQQAEEARDAQAQADLKATWANKTDADASNVVDTANQILSGPGGKQGAVRNTVKSVLDNLYDAKGNLETDPEILYGVRKDINDMLSKPGMQADPTRQLASDQLIALRNALDTSIEAAAPGFKQYLKNFSDASKPIDEMGVLQDAEGNLFKGPNATMRYSDFQRFMKTVVDKRQSGGANPYQSISDDTMQRLWNLRDDLRRSASAQDLARAPGSDTAPNIIDALKQYGKLSGQVGLEAAASHIFGPAGPLMVRGARAVISPVLQQRAAAAQAARLQQMLYPQNPLTPPPGGGPTP